MVRLEFSTSNESRAKAKRTSAHAVFFRVSAGYKILRFTVAKSTNGSQLGNGNNLAVASESNSASFRRNQIGGGARISPGNLGPKTGTGSGSKYEPRFYRINCTYCYRFTGFCAEWHPGRTASVFSRCEAALQKSDFGRGHVYSRLPPTKSGEN
jgi:hypothetical protein